MKLKVALILFIIVGLSFTVFQLYENNHPDIITQKEAEAVATKLYGGKVLSASLNSDNNQYQLSVDHEKGIYQMNVDGTTKKVSDVKLIKKKENAVSVAEAKNKIETELNGQVTEIKPTEGKEKTLIEATVEKNHTHYLVQYDVKTKTILSHSEVPKESTNQNQSPPSKEDVSPPAISGEKAASIALQQASGKVKDVSEVTNQNGKHYKITIEGPSENAHVYIQANTGNVSSISTFAKEQPQPDSEQDDDDDDDDDSDNDDDD